MDSDYPEEKAGKVRWLRPDYQIARFGKDLPTAEPGLGLTEKAASPAKAKRPAWPSDVISQFGAVKRVLAEEALSPSELAARFTGAKAEIVRKHLDILLVMGELFENPDGRYQSPPAPRAGWSAGDAGGLGVLCLGAKSSPARRIAMPLLVAWTGSNGVSYRIEDRGHTFLLTAEGNVMRAFEDTVGDAGRAEWLALSDTERTAWAEELFS